ncbi:unnamed protein product [Owenia fusiformis]|uniref:Uncharacterized protein n=1 Tax=Owenia fusiformis TaxID=6347 RepID=A0A8S4Q5T2_OWEFU|nr:unnamed protein product [Owenia fusiformis]
MLFYKTDAPGRNWKLLALLITFALGTMVNSGKDDVMVLFALNRPLCWNSIIIGYFTATYALLLTVGSILGIKLFGRCLTDGGIAILAVGIVTVMNAFQAFVSNTTMMFLVPVIGMFGTMFLPLIQSIMSKTVLEDEQGALFAVIGSIETATILGSISLFNMIYAGTVHWFAGFVFLVTTGISLSALATYCIYVRISGIQLMTSKQKDRIPLLPD